MPMAAPRFCSVPGCPSYAISAVRSRCPEHARAQERSRGSAYARGYDKAWQKRRARHLAEHPDCVEPGCSRPATDVDHIMSIAEAPNRRLDAGNLRGLCHSHHASRTGRDQHRHVRLRRIVTGATWGWVNLAESHRMDLKSCQGRWQGKRPGLPHVLAKNEFSLSW